VSIVDPNTIEIHTSVSQSDIVKVSQGMEVEIQLDAYEGKTFTGSITEIDTTPEEQNGISKFKTVVSLNNPDNLQLFSGMQANLTIKLKDIPQ
jgi:HlyD family secretion protein